MYVGHSVAQDMHSLAQLIATTQSHIPAIFYAAPHVDVLVIPYSKLPRNYLERLKLPRTGQLSYGGLTAMLEVVS